MKPNATMLDAAGGKPLRLQSDKMETQFRLVVLGCLLAAGTAAQTPSKPSPGAYQAPQRTICLRPAKIYLSPDSNAAVIGRILPGQDVALMGISAGYAHVFANVSGWMRNQGLLPLTTPHGDHILMGAAIRLERQAENNPGEDRVAQNAARLFYRVTDDFPGSPLVPEALFRAGRIAWQLNLSRYGTKKGTYNYMLRGRLLERVLSKYPHTEWAARAAYQLLQKKLTCSDWIRKPSCIEKEGNVYRNYVQHFRTGPRTAEAIYEVAEHEAAAWWVYAQPGRKQNRGKSKSAKRKAEKWIARLQKQYPKSDWAEESLFLSYEIQNGLRPAGLGLKS